jgi:hypothetical protein
MIGTNVANSDLRERKEQRQDLSSSFSIFCRHEYESVHFRGVYSAGKLTSLHFDMKTTARTCIL